MYSILKPLLFLLDPEFAHHLGLIVLKCLGFAYRLGLCKRPLTATEPILRTETPFGIVDNPLGVAAGFDKNAEALWGWEALGFGFVEVGTVTPKAQEGNSHPRLFRFPLYSALVNRMGFNNDGMLAVAARIKRAKLQGLKIKVGGNIGKNKITNPELTAQDYQLSASALRDYVDYLVINVSSPNTPGLRDLQSEAELEKIIKAVRSVSEGKPLFVKVAPDRFEVYQEGILNLIQKYQLSGIICGNTLANHASCQGLDQRQIANLPPGGLSGKPILQSNLKLLKSYKTKAPTLFSIGVGGITQDEAALAYLKSGAQLIQIYTGLIFNGPKWLHSLLSSIADLRRHST